MQCADGVGTQYDVIPLDLGDHMHDFTISYLDKFQWIKQGEKGYKKKDFDNGKLKYVRLFDDGFLKC